MSFNGDEAYYQCALDERPSFNSSEGVEERNQEQPAVRKSAVNMLGLRLSRPPPSANSLESQDSDVEDDLLPPRLKWLNSAVGCSCYTQDGYVYIISKPNRNKNGRWVVKAQRLLRNGSINGKVIEVNAEKVQNLLYQEDESKRERKPPGFYEPPIKSETSATNRRAASSVIAWDSMGVLRQTVSVNREDASAPYYSSSESEESYKADTEQSGSTSDDSMSESIDDVSDVLSDNGITYDASDRQRLITLMADNDFYESSVASCNSTFNRDEMVDETVQTYSFESESEGFDTQ